MTNFRQFMAIPVMALCTLLTFSACSEDDTTEPGGGTPTVSLGEAAASRAGIAISVETKNATDISYAALFKAADATQDPIPAPADFKKVKIADLTDNTVLIPAADLSEFGDYVIYIYVSNKSGQSEQKKASVNYDDKNFAPLASFEVRNMTPYSLDVKVDIDAMCAKYVATVIRQSAYDEINFVDGAKNSIDPSDDQLQYGTQSFLVNEASAIIPESKLSKETRYDSNECVGLMLQRMREGALEEYVVAIYAVDKFGNSEVYTSKEAFTLPEGVTSATPTIEITPKTTYTKASASFTATGDCAKLIYGAVVSTVKDEAFWAEENKTEALAYLASLPLGDTPAAYTGSAITKDIPLIGKPGDKYVIYAMGITSDGKVGPMNYKVTPLKMPTLDGAATINSIAATSVDGHVIKWTVTPSDNATKIRILVADKNSFGAAFKDQITLEWTMTTDESPNGYGWWREMTKEQLAADGNVYTIEVAQADTEHIIRAIAQDASGKWGAIKEGPSQTTPPEEEDAVVDFSKGTGEVTLSITSQEPFEEEGAIVSYDATYTIAKGANTTTAYKIMFSDDSNFEKYEDFTDAKILASCQEQLTAEQIETAEVVEFNKEYTDYGLFTPSRYGTNWNAFITKDAAGNYKIAAVLIPGKDAYYPGN